MLKSYLEDPANATMPLAVELAFEVQVGEEENPYWLTGIVDRIELGDDGLVVVDFKSGRRKPKASEVQEDLQFIIYALAVERLFGQGVERVCYNHLRDGTCIDAYPAAEDFEHLQGDLLPKVSAAVERGEFAPFPGYYCNYCDFRELCDAENGLMWQRRRAAEHMKAEEFAAENQTEKEGMCNGLSD